MTDNLPDYTALEPSDGDDPTDLSTHERRADLLRRIIDAGSPSAVNQAQLAEERYGVHRSTISRDVDRLRESLGEQLGQDAKLTSKAVFEHVLGDLLETDDWRAKKAAFDVMMDWNGWLADIGEQHREPRKSSVDMDVRGRHSEVTYRVVREGDDEPLVPPEEADEDGTVDAETLGFTSGPSDIPVEPVFDPDPEEDVETDG